MRYTTCDTACVSPVNIVSGLMARRANATVSTTESARGGPSAALSGQRLANCHMA